MVLNLILTVLFNLVRGLFTLLPTWTPDLSTISRDFSQIGSTASWLNGYFPVTFLGTCIGLYLGARVFYYTWLIIEWSISMVKGWL